MAALLPSLGAERRTSASATIIATAAVIALLYYGRVFCIPVVISLILAFLLEPLVLIGMRMRIPRPLASFFACLVALVVLYFIGFGAYVQASGLTEDLPAYSQRLNELVDTVSNRVEATENRILQTLVPKRMRGADQPAVQKQTPVLRHRRKTEVTLPPPPTIVPSPPIQEVRIHPEQPSILLVIYHYLLSVYNILLMASFVPFLVYFMLSWRDHLRRSFLNLLNTQDRHIAGKTWRGITHAARAYVLGNFILGVLVSVVSSIVFFAMGLPYWLIIGILSGFLTLLPYVGLLLALIPPLVDGLAIFTNITPYLIIIGAVTVLHLIALNVLYPRVVGGRLHLNPLTVTVALMFWGTLWGGIGLVLAIPITAGIKAVCDNVPSWNGYGRILGD